MALLGKAAMVLLFDVASEAILEHDDWHSHEHLHERMLIPGFVRGSRWVALSGEARYFVMYEVENIDILASSPYLERLNNPSPWTGKIMKHYQFMKRGFCQVIGSSGFGLGYVGLLIRFSPQAAAESRLREWLTGKLLPTLPANEGLVSMHVLKASLTPELTEEQRIRGRDGGVDWLVLVTGYSAECVERLSADELSVDRLERRGAKDVATGIYQLRHTLTEREAEAVSFTA